MAGRRRGSDRDDKQLKTPKAFDIERMDSLLQRILQGSIEHQTERNRSSRMPLSYGLGLSQYKPSPTFAQLEASTYSTSKVFQTKDVEPERRLGHDLV